MRRAAVITLVLVFGSCAANRKTPPTFAETIAPIIYRNCSVCHRPGEAGPFPLLTYEDVVAKAQTIVDVTRSHYMPPWPADTTYSRFVGERVLSDADIQSIAEWVQSGTPLGDAAKAPPVPQFSKESSLGPPDLVVKMKEPVRIPGDNADHFFFIKLPYEIPQDRFVRAIEFVPGNRKLMHHMNGHIVQYEGQKKDPFVGPYFVDRKDLKTLEGAITPSAFLTMTAAIRN